MKLTFFGAAGEVTGSCHLVEAAGKRILLDCGMIQSGRDEDKRNAAKFGFDLNQLDAMILSHAHIDHVGRLPLLRKRGYRGPIYTQRATSHCPFTPEIVRPIVLGSKSVGGSARGTASSACPWAETRTARMYVSKYVTGGGVGSCDS